jgi:hypothetical protein
MTGREKLPYLLERSGLIGAEIGVEEGLFSEYLLKTGLFDKFYSIDPWPNKFPGVFLNGENLVTSNNEDTYFLAVSKLEKYEASNIIRADSEHASKTFDDESLDFVFLDGDHTYEGVKLDLRCWYNKVKKGGIFSGHDYMDYIMDCGGGITSHFGVKSAVDEFFAEIGIEVLKIEEMERERLEWIENYNSFPIWYSWYVIK